MLPGTSPRSGHPKNCVALSRRILAGGTFAPPSPEGARWTAGGGPEARSRQSLSAREFEVLRLTVCGLTGKGIAGQLGLSQKTVSTYRRRALDKLHVTSIADLVRYAIEHGMV